ncbi:MAG: proprotein convertase P-domain-containing protein [Planctomycetota bacterium]
MIGRSSRPTPSRCHSARCRRPLRLEGLETRNLLSVNPLSVELDGGTDLQSVTPEGPEQQALSHLAAAAETAHLQTGGSGLALVDLAEGHGMTTVAFQQTFSGLSVHGAYVTVVMDAQGSVQELFDHTRANLSQELSVGPVLDAFRAEQIATGGLELSGFDATSELVAYPTGKQLSLAWQVNTNADGSLSTGVGDYLSIIDAFSGDVLVQEKAGADYYDQFASDTGVFPRIVINNTIGAAGSRAYAAPFDAVAELSQGCSGTLIAPDLVIAARHCGGGSQVRFGDNGNAPIYIASVANTSFPAGGGSLLDGGDVSLVRLTQPVPANVATPMRLIEEGDSLEGMVAATIGYGFNGLGSSGHGFSSDGRRWGGENIIDAYGSPVGSGGSNIFSTDFDNGTGGANTIPGSDPTPLTFEATTAPGDSGGPLLVQIAGGEWVIAGVLSGGTTNTSVYGDISWWTGVAPFRNQIENAGGVFVGGGVGSVQLDQGVYDISDTIEVTVRDPNAIAPVQVTLTSDSGDTETVTLSPSGGNNYTGTINSAGGAVSGNDGTLQVSLFDEIEVTYEDPDDGMGNPLTATASAVVATVTHYESDDVPVAIQDLQTVRSDLTITDSGTILDVDVQLNINHTWDEDLNVFLVAPDGTRVELFSDVGGNGNNFNDTILDDEAGTDIASGGAPFAGRYRPAGDLSDFDGMDIAGTWTLEIFDDFQQDQGTLNSWCIYASVESQVVSGDFDGDGDYDHDDINALTNEIAAGTNGASFDLTGDGTVNLADRDAWLSEAGEANLGPGQSYLVGDANLDGTVDGADFVVWNDNKFTSNANWCDGDFNADGVIDGADFLAWNGNKFQSSDAVLAEVTPATTHTLNSRVPFAPVTSTVGSRLAAPAPLAVNVDRAFSDASLVRDDLADQREDSRDDAAEALCEALCQPLS